MRQSRTHTRDTIPRSHDALTWDDVTDINHPGHMIQYNEDKPTLYVRHYTTLRAIIIILLARVNFAIKNNFLQTWETCMRLYKCLQCM